MVFGARPSALDPKEVEQYEVTHAYGDQQPQRSILRGKLTQLYSHHGVAVVYL